MSQRQYPCFVVHKEPQPALHFYLSAHDFFCVEVFSVAVVSSHISRRVFNRARFVPNVPIYSDIPLDSSYFLTVEYEQVKASDLAAMRQRGEL